MPQKPSQDYEIRFARLHEALDMLPASAEKSEIEDAVADLQRTIESDTDVARQRDSMDRLATFEELASAIKPVTLELGFATGFKDWNGDGRYDGIEVYIIPRDRQGSAIKRPGSADVYLQAEGFLGNAKTIEKWNVPAGLMANSWNESLFPAYVLRLQWKGAAPEESRARVRVDFKPLAGEPISAEKAIEEEPL